MIDIITVVFQEELPILKAQAQSVDLYCQNIGLQTIYVVVNDDESVVKEIDPAWWGSLSKYVKIIHRDYFNCKFVENGWVSQQVLKILCATLSQNQYTMVLDAKTILMQSVEISRLFDSHGRQTWGYIPIQPVFEPARKIVSKLFNIDLQHIAGPGGIPFFFHNDLVRSMINKVTQLTNQLFSDWFQEQGMVTEFILYTGYIQYQDGTLDFKYSKNIRSYNLCNICHSEVTPFDKKFLEMLDPNILIVSIHRNKWNKLTIDQQLLYIKFLQSRGITQTSSIL